MLAISLSTIAFGAPRAQEKSAADARNAGGSIRRQSLTREGVTVQLAVDPIKAEAKGATDLLAESEVNVRFTVTDANSGKALTDLHPAAWIDPRGAAGLPDPKACREKVQSFLQHSFNKTAEIDLNAYFILALNQEPNISVLDPLTGFGGSRLYTLVALNSPGEDWVLTEDGKTLFVSMPRINQVAAVDTVTWRVISNIDAGVRPTRLALQHDGKYLWVGNDAVEEKESGIAVIDAASLKVVAQVKTGAGHHEIAFTDDDRFTFASNKQAGTVSVIDVRALERIKDIQTGPLPVSMAFSTLSKALYVANEGDGTIVEIDGSSHEVLARMNARPGLRTLRIPNEGRYGFAVNKSTNSVNIFDMSTNRLVHEVAVGPSPDQISFTRQFAYVRSMGSAYVTMIKIADLDKEAPLTHFPAGQRPPQESTWTSVADAIVPAIEEGAVLVANPADKSIYFYAEGMAAPMGSLQNYRRDARAVLIWNNSLRETAPGVYSTTVRLGRPGLYDVAVFLDSPRFVNCFPLSVATNPDAEQRKEIALKVELVRREGSARAGDNLDIIFRVVDATSGKPKPGLTDLGTLVFLVPGTWQQRGLAQPLADGSYKISVVPPRPGLYYIYFQSPSLGVRLNQIPPLSVRVTADASGAKQPPRR